MEYKNMPEHKIQARTCQNTRNTPYLPLSFIAIWVILALLLSAIPANAQGPLATPTPLPGIVSTQTSAQATKVAAEGQIEAQRAIVARAAEMIRNGEAQAAQADRDLEAARQAAAAQNSIAVGEAIGRVESNLAQLRETVRGQAGIISESLSIRTSQSITIERLQKQVSDLQSDNNRLSKMVTDVATKNERMTMSADSNVIVYLVIGVLGAGVLAVVIIAIVQHRRETLDPYQPDDTSRADYADAVDGEYTTNDYTKND